MPKLKTRAPDPTDASIKLLISSGMTRLGLKSKREAAHLTRIPERTFYRKFDNPSLFTVEELKMICKGLQIPKGDREVTL